MRANNAAGPIHDAPVLAVAVDVPTAREAIALADALAGQPAWLKVGLELFTAEGPALLRLLGDRGSSLFLDLKFYDIPNTVRGAVRSAARSGVSMLTVHLSGGKAMCEAALEGREDARRAGGRPPLIVGVTVLTSEGGDEASLAATILERARLARQYGLDGVVCSGHEAAAIKASCGPAFLCVCPGIRFAGTGTDDQVRVSTPDGAVKAGADMLVMGRPITRADYPGRECEKALALMHGAVGKKTF